MYLSCTTEESSQRQRQFEFLLLDKMNKQPYAQITVAQLCQEADVSRNAFYRYFDSKDDVLDALIDYTLLDYYRDLDFPLKHQDSYRKGIAYFLQYWLEQKPLLDALQKNGLERRLLERCRNHSIQWYMDAFHGPLLENEESRAQIILFSVNGLFSVILDWHRKGYSQSIEQMVSVIERLMLKPLITI